MRLFPRPQPIPFRLIAVAALFYGVLLALWMALPERLLTDISHDRNEDWDWQLTFYEVSRITLLKFRQIPFWNPYTQGGVPLLANPESPFLYPGFLWVLLFGTGPGLRLWMWFHLVLGASGAVGLAGRAGIRPWVSLFAPVPWLMTAFIPGFIGYGHIMFLAVGWLPWMLLLLPHDGGVERKSALAALCLSATFFMGGHYIYLYGMLLLGLNAWWRLPFPPLTRWVMVGFLALDVALTGHRNPPWSGAFLTAAGLTFLASLASGGKTFWSSLRSRGADELEILLRVAIPAALLPLVKILPGRVLLGRAERLTDVPLPTAQDPFTLDRLWDVFLGMGARPSGHEGNDVYQSSLPLVLAGVGLLLGGGPGRRFGAGALFFLGLALCNNLPLDYASLLHRLPGFDLFRVTERYALVYSLFIGLTACAGMEGMLRVAERPKVLRGMGALALGGWLLWQNISYGRLLWNTHLLEMRPGSRPSPSIPAVLPPFRQVEGLETNFDSVRRNRGRLDCWTTAWLGETSPGLAAEGSPGYRGEVFLEGRGSTSSIHLTPNRIEAQVEAEEEGWVRVNQNGFPGWWVEIDEGPPVEASVREGTISARIPKGSHHVTLWYHPPGLEAGLAGSLLGLAWIGWSLRRR